MIIHQLIGLIVMIGILILILSSNTLSTADVKKKLVKLAKNW